MESQLTSRNLLEYFFLFSYEHVSLPSIQCDSIPVLDQNDYCHGHWDIASSAMLLSPVGALTNPSFTIPEQTQPAQAPAFFLRLLRHSDYRRLCAWHVGSDHAWCRTSAKKVLSQGVLRINLLPEE